MVSKEGFLIIDKPPGITSFGVIYALRKMTGIKKIGHAGTLDPLATGILICAIGRSATKKIDLFLKKDKSYIAEIELGATSSTYDADGEITRRDEVKDPGRKSVEKATEYFVGTILQSPPAFSAKKINGVRAYQLARLGMEVKLKQQKVNIKQIKIVHYDFPKLVIEVDCGSGTYIRSLANDIGEKLKIGGYITSLRRIRSERFIIDQAINMSHLTKDNWEDFIFPIETFIEDAV